MKYAFVFGSNVFVVPHGSVSYTDKDQITSFLTIRSVYHDIANHQPSALSIDAEIADTEGHKLTIRNNQDENATGLMIKEERDHITVSGQNGTEVFSVQQLDDVSAMNLEHNIIAELEVNMPVVVIRIRGNFMLGALHIEADNEKLYINGESTANSVLAGKTGLSFAVSGVEVV